MPIWNARILGIVPRDVAETRQRILAQVIVQNFVIGAGGQMELATVGSTRPITSRVSHAGIVTTMVYELTE
jgi:hypothetical protein